MNPLIDETHFGSITISGTSYAYDVVINLKGQVNPRKKELSTAIYGTSHKISLEEIKDLFEAGAQQMIIGTGQTGFVELSDDAEEFLRQNNCSTQLHPTPQAIKIWNNAKGVAIGLFHVTC